MKRSLLLEKVPLLTKEGLGEVDAKHRGEIKRGVNPVFFSPIPPSIKKNTQNSKGTALIPLKKWEANMPDFRPFCVHCATRMRCKKNDVSLVKKDDSLQFGDLYECPWCRIQVICGFGEPILAIGLSQQYVERWSQRESAAGVYFDRTHDLDTDEGGNHP